MFFTWVGRIITISVDGSEIPRPTVWMVLKPCEWGFQLPFLQLVSLPGFLKHQPYRWRNSNCLTLTVFDLEVQVNQNGQNPLGFGYFGNCLKQNPFLDHFLSQKNHPVPLPEVGYITGSWSFFRPPKNKHPNDELVVRSSPRVCWDRLDQFWTEVLRPNVQDKNLSSPASWPTSQAASPAELPPFHGRMFFSKDTDTWQVGPGKDRGIFKRWFQLDDWTNSF